MDTVLIQVITIVINIFYVKGYTEKVGNMIYILVWTPITETPFTITPIGQSDFYRRGCYFLNCFVTDQPSFLKDILDFDVIMFNVINLKPDMDLPSYRSPSQKYVLVAVEPAGIHKVPNEFNEFFNLTWTYKLDSDVPFPFIVVKDEWGEIIGPKTEMHWIDYKKMRKTSDHIIKKLQNKRIAAAWFVANCDAPSGRLEFVNVLKQELATYNHSINIYGDCGSDLCSPEAMEQCSSLIESSYYFHLAFENSLCEDYVTQTVVTAIDNYAVPVVYGSANYTRFLPDGMYINAYKLGPNKLAKKMAEIISNKAMYYDFFKWRGYYTIHYTGEDNFHHEVCGLCALFNNMTRMAQKKTYRTNVWFNEREDGAPVIYYDSDKNYVIDESQHNTADLDTSISDIYNYIYNH